MQTKNVYYSNQPDRVIVTERGGKAIVEFPYEVPEKWRAEVEAMLEA